jgi:UrcA family protein
MNSKARDGWIVSAALSLAWAGIGMIATHAASAAEAPKQEIVNVRDLELNRPADVAQLYKRLRAAARNVCAPYNPGETGNKVTWDRCRDATLARAIERLNLPALTMYHSAKVGRNKSPTMLAGQH